MTIRIGSYGQNQLLVNQMLNQQSAMADTQQQVSTGYKSSDYQGIANDAASLLSSQAMQTSTQSYIDNNTKLTLKLQTYDTTLQGVASTADSLRQAVTEALSNNSGTGLMDTVKSLLQQATSQLNTKIDGQYIFGGTRTDTTPVNTTDPTALEAMAEPPSAAFSNNQTKAQAQVDDNTTMTYGQLASDVGQPLLQSIQRLLKFDAGTLPSGATGTASSFGSPLTQSQRDFLTNELSQMQTNSNDLNAKVAQNGVLQSELQKVQTRQTTEVNTMKTFISGIQDADMASAITKLNQQQLSLQASYNVLSTLNKLSLVNFL